MTRAAQEHDAYVARVGADSASREIAVSVAQSKEGTFATWRLSGHRTFTKPLFVCVLDSINRIYTSTYVCVCVCVSAAHDAFCLGDVGLLGHANDLVRIKKADGTPKFVTTADLFGLAKEDLEV